MLLSVDTKYMGVYMSVCLSVSVCLSMWLDNESTWLSISNDRRQATGVVR